MENFIYDKNGSCPVKQRMWVSEMDESLRGQNRI